MKAGAPLDAGDSRGNTALHYSLEKGNAKVRAICLLHPLLFVAVFPSDVTPIACHCLQICNLQVCRCQYEPVQPSRHHVPFPFPLPRPYALTHAHQGLVF